MRSLTTRQIITYHTDLQTRDCFSPDMDDVHGIIAGSLCSITVSYAEITVDELVGGRGTWIVCEVLDLQSSGTDHQLTSALVAFSLVASGRATKSHPGVRRVSIDIKPKRL